MTKIVDWTCEYPPNQSNASGHFYYPGGGFCGCQSTGAFRTARAHGMSGSPLTLTATGTIVDSGGVGTVNPGTLNGNPARIAVGATWPAVMLRDGALVPPAQDPAFWLFFSNRYDTAPDLQQWSARIIMLAPASGVANSHHFTLLRHAGAGLAPTIGSPPLILAAVNNANQNLNTQTLINCGSGVVSNGPNFFAAWTAAWYRIEVQADTTQSPQIIVRGYGSDGATMNTGALYGNHAQGSAACGLGFGDYYGMTGGGTDFGYCEIEVWNNRNADGLYAGGTSGPTDWAPGSGGASNNTKPLHVNYPGARRTTFNKFNTSLYTTPNLNFTPNPSGGMVKFDQSTTGSLSYGPLGSHKMDLILPPGIPPTGGFPCVMYVHGGFWASGDKQEWPAAWVNALVNAGFAVCSTNYILSTLCNGLGGPSINGPYPAYGSVSGAGGGRWPSYPCNVKLAVARLRDRYSEGSTVNGGADVRRNGSGGAVNPNLIAISGHSAGSHVAYSTAFTRDLAADANGVDCRLATAASGAYNTDELGAHYLGADPSFFAVMGYAIPYDLKVTTDNDYAKAPPCPSTAQNNFGGGSVVWSVSAPASSPVCTPIGGSAKALIAQPFNGTFPSTTELNAMSPADHVVRNNAKCSSLWVRGVWGWSDHLVSIANRESADAIMPSKVAHWESDSVPAYHDFVNYVAKNNFADDITFLRAAVTAAGVTPVVPPPTVPGGVSRNIPTITQVATIATPLGGATTGVGYSPQPVNNWDGGNWDDGNWT